VPNLLVEGLAQVPSVIDYALAHPNPDLTTHKDAAALTGPALDEAKTAAYQMGT